MNTIFTSHILPPISGALLAGVAYQSIEGSFACGSVIGLAAGVVYHVALAVLNKNCNLKPPMKHSIAIFANAVVTFSAVPIAIAYGVTAISAPALCVIWITALAVDIIFQVVFYTTPAGSSQKPVLHPRPATRPDVVPAAPMPAILAAAAVQPWTPYEAQVPAAAPAAQAWMPYGIQAPAAEPAAWQWRPYAAQAPAAAAAAPAWMPYTAQAPAAAPAAAMPYAAPPTSAECRTMFAALADLVVTASSSQNKARLLRDKPFVITIRGDNVTLETAEENEAISKDYSKAELYRLWLDARRDPVTVREKMVAAYYRREPDRDIYRISLYRSALRDRPEEVINLLTEEFNRSIRTELNVTFQREVGIDAGGLRRQLISDLFYNVCQIGHFQRLENGLYRPRSREQNNALFPLISDNDKKKLRQLGEIIMFCLNAAQEYPIGKIFDKSFFQAIITMDWSLLRMNFNDINFQDPEIFAKMLGMFKRMLRDDAREMLMIGQFERHILLTSDSPVAEIQEAYAGVELDDPIQQLHIGNDVNKMKLHLPAIKAALRSSFIGLMRANFAPVHAIATGMKRSRFNSRRNFIAIQRLRPDELDVLLQGRVSKEEISRGLNFNDIPAHIQNWLKSWINRANDSQLELFIFAATGSRALGRGEYIRICNQPALQFHTCSKTMDLNCVSIQSEEHLTGMLEASLAAVRHQSGFDMG